ncbi:sensor histidine kinase [Mastigocoleus testarum]|uniref:histidine kinase n=1 Tax=Mastigocoleus testarum BC008 TaxID=371196 RepID=A0A0V7ZF75_9CYAN|nr:HAMP domain-containing sensor histidine kinase [Mastigocoleus testarum]KST63161.1 hypothetical protein BC008_12720 [Mastigocoleus testarum BC008]KST63194.1 hypothetical protein BC008_12875 [Mastigocoleus testarum BC008]
MASLASKLLLTGKAIFSWLFRQISQRFKQLIYSNDSADYIAWRNQFLWRRLGLCFWVAFPVIFCSFVLDCYRIFYLNQTEFYPQELKHLLVIENLVMGFFLLVCLKFHKTKFGRKYPGALFLCVFFSLTLIQQIIGTFCGVAILNLGGWGLTFTAQATIMPVRWRLHLLSQLLLLGYYIGVNSVLGFTNLYRSYPLITVELILFIFWFCFICDLGVYSYDRLQRNEFESRRELRIFLHAISHDLCTPLMGNAIVFQNLLKKSDSEVIVSSKILKRLLEGNSRQINLIQSLREAYTLEVQGVKLHCEPIKVSTVVNSVLYDLEPFIRENNTTVHNLLSDNLPLICADPTQLSRVFSNLISNALKHNPYEITLTIDANPQGEKILCRVRDNGVGITQNQCKRIFELYTRGENARFMPGLGLGLYVCRQVIIAHGGNIGVQSQPGIGSTFWFTLPIIE